VAAHHKVVAGGWLSCAFAFERIPVDRHP
jgi:hypothetical protein